jgi:hypothetical protein
LFDIDSRFVKKIEEDTSGEIFYVREKQRNFYENFQTSDKEWGIIKSMYLYDNDYIQIKNIGTTDVKDRDYFCENSEIIYGKTILPIHHLKANSDIKSKKAVIYFPGSHALFRDNLVYPSFFDDVLQVGIDIIYPEYLSTYSRRDDVKTDIGNTSMRYRDNLINWVKEVRYAVELSFKSHSLFTCAYPIIRSEIIEVSAL